MGVIHVLTGLPSEDEDSFGVQDSLDRDLALASSVAERMSVALANLRLREALRNQAIRDTLTGLYNRRFLEEYLDREMLRASRTGAPLSVLMIDVDQFKQFNDAFGHQAGDFALAQIGHLLRSAVRAGDVACRLGGEELLLLLPETPLDRGMARADEIRQAIEQLTLTLENKTLRKITVSIGVASAPEHGTRVEDLLWAADKALYRAKSNGRNRVVPAPHNSNGESLVNSIQSPV